MVGPSAATTDILWRFFVGGLLALLVVDLIGLLVMTGLGKSSTVFLTIFTRTLAAIVGVFVPSPVKN
jgi:hypothetical protein